MKNKIKQLSKGEFRLSKPEIVFSETHIQISVGEGEVYKGSFLIKNLKDGDIRGLVYPSSVRVHCLEQGFEGNPVKVHYTFDSAGLLPGQVENGKFTIVCNGGEYDLTFSAMVEKPFIMTAYGKIQNISDFRRLAVQDFEEAAKLEKMVIAILNSKSSECRNSTMHFQYLEYENKVRITLWGDLVFVRNVLDAISIILEQTDK